MPALKCKICGGDIANDYLTGACMCENCGNRWSISELYPDYQEYSPIIAKMNRANELLDGSPGVVQAGQSLILYKSAAAECVRHSGEIASDLVRLCKDGQAHAERLKCLAMARAYRRRNAFKEALAELEKVKDMPEAAELLEEYRRSMKEARKRRIPYAVFVGMILPAIVCLVLKEKAGFPVGLCGGIFTVGAAACGYAVYLDGALSMVVEIFSYMLLIPLLLFLVLAYGLHISAGLAAALAIGGPAAIVLLMAVFAERQ